MKKILLIAAFFTILPFSILEAQNRPIDEDILQHDALPGLLQIMLLRDEIHDPIFYSPYGPNCTQKRINGQPIIECLLILTPRTPGQTFTQQECRGMTILMGYKVRSEQMKHYELLRHFTTVGTLCNDSTYLSSASFQPGHPRILLIQQHRTTRDGTPLQKLYQAFREEESQ